VPDVLDASAALAWLLDETGFDVVEGLLDGALMSAVNWSEVLQKARRSGRDPGDTADMLEVYGVSVVAVTKGDATLAAKFWEPQTSLSLGDRFCLATAYRFGARAVTAERSWAELDTGAEVLVIR
jgi:ribonuclease VapC